ncbi:MAG: hypothetical protein ACJ74Z_16085 [Bryobacteraceae bacterium]|jgi:hypothetical protein
MRLCEITNGTIKRIPIKPPVSPLVLCPATPVTRSSPAALKNALEQYARYFRREFRYDFVPYTKHEHVHENLSAYLLPQRDKRFWAGGCSFWKEEGVWTLTWMWMHPFDRHQGILKAAWPYFEREHGPFRIDSPVSIPMQYFLLRQGVAESRLRGGYRIGIIDKGQASRSLHPLCAPRLASSS